MSEWTTEQYEQAVNRSKRELKKEINIEYLCNDCEVLSAVADKLIERGILK